MQALWMLTHLTEHGNLWLHTLVLLQACQYGRHGIAVCHLIAVNLGHDIALQVMTQSGLCQPGS